MGKVGGHRNFGYGKQLKWAGKNALRDLYGHGHFATQAAHFQRWGYFCEHLKSNGITNAENITKDIIHEFGNSLGQNINSKNMTVSYGQNILSSVNTVLQTMRNDKSLHVSPVEFTGCKSSTRTSAPEGFDLNKFMAVVDQLRTNGDERTAITAELGRHFGLRFREASLLDARKALNDASRTGCINITNGTKGGRGKSVDRLVPVTSKGYETLIKAAEIQGDNKNIVPCRTSFYEWRNQTYHNWSTIKKDHSVKGFHSLRASYACSRYQQLTGQPAPVIDPSNQLRISSDKWARGKISYELGHSRIDVVSAYIGVSK